MCSTHASAANSSGVLFWSSTTSPSSTGSHSTGPVSDSVVSEVESELVESELVESELVESEVSESPEPADSELPTSSPTSSVDVSGGPHPIAIEKPNSPSELDFTHAG